MSVRTSLTRILVAVKEFHHPSIVNAFITVGRSKLDKSRMPVDGNEEAFGGFCTWSIIVDTMS